MLFCAAAAGVQILAWRVRIGLWTGIAALALVALPNALTVLALSVADGWSVRAARHDEEAMRDSPLAEAYAAYSRRAGMFIPKLHR